MDAEQSLRILLIDDEAMSADLIRYALPESSGFELLHLMRPERALESTLKIRPTVLLVDLRMPIADGFQVMAALKSHPDTAQIPVILLSSEDDPVIKARAFAAGANDYLVKWPDSRELSARLQYHSDAYLAHLQRDHAFKSLHESQKQLLHRTEELKQSQAALLSAQRMEVVGKLTGGVAHDFNNVLQIISNNLQLLKMQCSDNDTGQKRIRAAMEGVDRGARLASHLLSFARRQPLQPDVVNIGGLLRGMEDLLRRSVGNMCELEIKVDDGVWNTLADPVQLENMILNLVINARDAMGLHGHLNLRVSNARDGVGSTGEYVLLEVCDTGKGMEPHVLERAFEPFFSTKPTGHGAGLGLSMVYGFVKQSGGHIQMESEVGHGTQVRVFLPREHGVAAHAAVPRREAEAEGRETILVVEDEPDIRETAARMLSDLGYRTREAGDADEAMKIIESDDEIDLLFTDVIMPGRMRGSELAEKAQRMRPSLRILFTSGYSNGELLKEGRLAQGISLLKKPYSADALATNVRHILRQSPATSVA